MRNKTDRLAAMHERADKLRKKRDAFAVKALGTASAILLVALIGTLAVLQDVGHSISADSFYGTSMLGENTGGYILVAIVTFMAGVLITVLCIKLKRYREQKQQNRE
ncbi:MAG: hypothetical protein J6X17_05320 [Lachnospiraceae bacterium]|nr:hypothetical protein [Lachnospiraceae bacterium]